AGQGVAPPTPISASTSTLEDGGCASFLVGPSGTHDQNVGSQEPLAHHRPLRELRRFFRTKCCLPYKCDFGEWSRAVAHTRRIERRLISVRHLPCLQSSIDLAHVRTACAERRRIRRDHRQRRIPETASPPPSPDDSCLQTLAVYAE